MAFEMRQQQRMSQELRMTPQLQQAIKLLQLNHLELAEALQTELLENPLLEEAAGEDERAPRANEEPAPSQLDEATWTRDSGDDARSMDEAVREIDWEAYVENYSSPLPSTGVTPDGDLPGPDQTLTREGNLTDHLLQQLSEVEASELERRIAEVIIYNLDEHGYFRNQTVEELAENLDIDPDLVEDALLLVQEFDPTGVGARDLAECLLLQAMQTMPEQRVVIAVLRHHLHDLEHRDHAGIARALRVSREEVVQAHRLIKQLDPRPGSRYADADVRYIAPDIYIEKRNDEWVAILNDDGLPRLRISRDYRRMLGGASSTSDEKNYVKERLNSARFMLRSIEQRQRTILRVTESIIKFQHDFFEKGIQHLRPLVLRDVADDIEMHESTVSRVTTNKYVHTPRGLFELKFFFNSPIRRTDGADDIAAEAVKHHIRALIEREDGDNPLSDQKLVELLEEHQGIRIARRTVAKYREALGIASSSKRRRLS